MVASVVRFLLFVLILAACGAAGDGGNDGGSQASADNDRSNDGASDRDEWYADDPYMPTDDYVIQQIRAELDAERNAMNYENEMRKARVRRLLTNAVAITVSIVGLASAVFCSSILLYDLRMEMLMRRYASEGVVVEGRILVSDPDIEEATKTTDAVKPRPKIQNNDSYSIMTDDESYIAGSRSLYSFSVKSGAHDAEEGQKSDRMGEKRWRDPIGSEVSFTDGSNQSSTSKSRGQASNAKTATSERTQKISDVRYHVIVEYDDISYHDAISKRSSEIIRKRLWIMSEDVEGTNNGNFSTKLHVLRDKPKSGYPSGEVRRALRWQKRLSFNVHIILGLSFAICGAFVVKNILSPTLLYCYIGLLVLQLPIVHMFLRRSFTKVISESYLENGCIKPSKLARYPVDKQKMIFALKQGTSFGHL